MYGFGNKLYGFVSSGGINDILRAALQWLYTGTSPATVTDKTANALDADYVQSNCLEFNGSSSYGSIAFNDSMFGQLPYTQTTDVLAYQGLAMDGTYMYTSGGDKTTAVISRRLKASPYTIQSTNASPFGSIPTVNHLNDICIFGDTLYAAICYRLDENNYSDPYIVGYNKTTLVQTELIDCSAFALSTTAVTHDGTDLFIMELGQNNPATFNKVHKITTAGVLIETITLSRPLPNGAEGITIFEDEIYVSARPDGVLVYDMDGAYQRKCLFDTFTKNPVGKFTGIDFTTDDKVIGITDGFPDGQVMFLDSDQLNVNGWGFECEFIPDNTTSAQGLVTSWRFDNDERVFNLQINSGDVRFLIGDALGTLNSTIITTPVSSGLNIVDAWYDTSTDTLNLQNNGGTVSSATYGGVFSIAENPIIIGDTSVPTSHIWYDGKISIVKHYAIISGEKVYTQWPSMAVGEGDEAIGKAEIGDSATLVDCAWATADVRASNLFDGFSLWEHATSPDILAPYSILGLPVTFSKTGYTKTADYPAITGDQIHNNCETKVQQKAANTEFLLTPFWSTDGVNYDAKSFADLRAHLNFEDNVVICSTASTIVAAWTYAITRQWTALEYQQYIAYLARQGCTGTGLVPAEVTAGTGIGPDSDWADAGGGNILFVEGV